MVNKLHRCLPIYFPSERHWNGSWRFFRSRVCSDNHGVCSYLQGRQISSESDIQSKSASKCTNKGGTQTKKIRIQQFICLCTFLSLLFSLFSLCHTEHDKHHWNFVSRSSICVVILNFPEFIIKSHCLLLAVPRDSPNCKKHSEEKHSHEREYNIGKDLNLKIVLTKKYNAKFYETKLSQKI